MTQPSTTRLYFKTPKTTTTTTTINNYQNYFDSIQIRKSKEENTTTTISIKKKKSYKMKNHKCYECLEEFDYASEYRDHQKLHRSGSYECSICGKVLAKSGMLAHHYIKYHNFQFNSLFNEKFYQQNIPQKLHSEEINLSHIINDKEKINNPLTLTNNRNLQLKQDASQYSAEKQLKSDNNISNEIRNLLSETPLHSNLIQDKNPQGYLRSKVPIKYATSQFSNDQNKCTQCNKVYRSRAALAYHVTSQHKEDKHKCPECSKEFTHIKNLKAHLKRHGAREKACSLCPSKFFTTSELGYHFNAVHMNAKCWKCNACGKQFSRSSSYYHHIEKHKTRRFECTICHKMFGRKSHAESHVKQHGSNKTNSSFSEVTNKIKEHFRCDNCNLIFSDEILRKKHSCISDPTNNSLKYVNNENPELSSNKDKILNKSEVSCKNSSRITNETWNSCFDIFASS